MPLLNLLKGRRGTTQQNGKAVASKNEQQQQHETPVAERNGVSHSRADGDEQPTTSGGNLQPCDGCLDFTVGRIVGTGSYGIVRIARHRATNTPVAIKVSARAAPHRLINFFMQQLNMCIFLSIFSPRLFRIRAVQRGRPRRLSNVASSLPYRATFSGF